MKKSHEVGGDVARPRGIANCYYIESIPPSLVNMSEEVHSWERLTDKAGRKKNFVTIMYHPRVW